MEKLTFYELLQIRKTASSAEIQIAYEQLLKDARDKLADSPLYYNREKQLNDAYNTLIKAESRQIYNEKLHHEQLLAEKLLRQQKNQKTHQKYKIQKKQSSSSDLFSPAVFFGKLIFSKAFLGSIVLIIALLVLIPSGKDRVVSDALNKQYELQNRQLEFEQQKYQQRISSQLAYREKADARGKEREEENKKRREKNKQEVDFRRFEREQLRISQNEQRLLRQEERKKKQQEYTEKSEKKALQRKLQQDAKQLARSRREQEYAAKRRINKIIYKQERTAYIKKKKEKVVSGEMGY